MIDDARLRTLRREVDHVDLQLVGLMAARQRLVEDVARVKGDRRRLRDREREQEILARVGEAALAAGLSPGIALPVWERLLEASVRHEREVLERSGEPDREAACCGCRDAEA